MVIAEIWREGEKMVEYKGRKTAEYKRPNFPEYKKGKRRWPVNIKEE